MAAPLRTALCVSFAAFATHDGARLSAQHPSPAAVLSERDRAAVTNEILTDRLDHLLPGLMRECGLDMWLVINREYAEDPVYLTLVPEPVFAARRTTILMFFDRGVDARGQDRGLERLTVSRYALGDLYESSWDGGSDDEQWAQLAKLIRARDPQKIGINTSRDWAHCDGLTAGLRDRLVAALGEDASRLTSAQDLCIRWIETRTARELEVYPQLMHLARGAIAEAFSERVITPGVTTTADVRWWLRQRFRDLGLPVWFQPYCNVQRKSDKADAGGSIYGVSEALIQRGDVLHTDVGIVYLRLCSDTQEMAYVLRAGETEVPQGLRDAMATGNRFQDHLTSAFATHRTGNEILRLARQRCADEGLDVSIYTHPLGFFGHAAGPTIGMWDNQGPTPVRGDWKLYPNTCYAIEGNVKVAIPEWDGQLVQIKLEQDAWFDGSKVTYIGGRQTAWHVVR